MNTPSPHRPDPSRLPLDAEERALADALSGLPAAEPGAELDDRILNMARAAVARPLSYVERRPRRRAGLWWLGSAAGAVLAAGIGWQLSQQHGFGLGGETLQIAPQRSQPEARPVQAEHGFDIEIIRRPPTESTAAAPGNAEESASTVISSKPAGAAQRSAALPPAAPAAPARAPASAAPDAGLASAAAPAPVPEATLDEISRAAVDSDTAQSAADAPPAQGMTRGDILLDRIEVTGSRVRGPESLDDQGFPPLLQDARLTPEDWLLRVRARRAAGQAEQARKSLQEFVRGYPYLVVPEDLKPLLNERP